SVDWLQRRADSANEFRGMLLRASLRLPSVSVWGAAIFRGRFAFLVRQLYLSELLVTRIATIGLILRKCQELSEARWIRTFNHAKARFVAHVLCDFWFRWTIVESEWCFAFNKPAWIKAIERPHT